MAPHEARSGVAACRLVAVVLVACLGVAACGDDPDDADGGAAGDTTTSVETTIAESAPTTGTTPTTAQADGAATAGPALDDWDGRRYDVGQASNPRPVDGGHVVDWDRYGLPTVDRNGAPRDPDAFSSDVVEPWGSIAGLSNFPFTNENEMVRQLTVTDAAWVYEVAEDDILCPGDEVPDEDSFPPPPWREVALDEWVGGLGDDGDLVLLTYDALGRVVQVRPIAGC